MVHKIQLKLKRSADEQIHIKKPRIPCGQVCLRQIMQKNEPVNQVTCMINFDDLDFSGCRSEENYKFLLTLSVYQYQRA